MIFYSNYGYVAFGAMKNRTFGRQVLQAGINPRTGYVTTRATVKTTRVERLTYVTSNCANLNVYSEVRKFYKCISKKM